MTKQRLCCCKIVMPIKVESYLKTKLLSLLNSMKMPTLCLRASQYSKRLLAATKFSLVSEAASDVQLLSHRLDEIKQLVNDG